MNRVHHTPYWQAEALCWPASSDAPPRRCDVAVVGGGFTGIAAAYALARHGRHVVVWDGGRLGGGASGRNGGQALTGWPRDLARIAATHGPTAAVKLWALSRWALEAVAGLVQGEGIACELAQVGHVEAAASLADAERLRQERDALWRLVGHETAWWDRAVMERRLGTAFYRGGLYDAESLQFHPFRYAHGLAWAAARRGAEFRQGTAVETVTAEGGRFRVDTGRGATIADHVILAVNAYRPPSSHWLRARIVPVTAAVVATAPVGARIPRDLPTVSDQSAAYRYFRRTEDGRLIFGARAGGDSPDERAQSLMGELRRLFPQLTPVDAAYTWRGKIALTADGLPHLGRTPQGLWFAGGYNGHGAVLSTGLGLWIAAMVTGEALPEEVGAVLGADAMRPVRLASAPPARVRSYRIGNGGGFWW